ncbi:MAG: biotin/lipoyl-binding protein [Lachnospiraceae bacterium]|nr:biotin/lipoyl-binding protein [Lachnospiraceae bacterium]
MRKYSVKINGVHYEIEIEEITGSSSAASSTTFSRPASPVKAVGAPTIQASSPVKAPVPKPAAVPASGSGRQVNSPMPGNVLKVNVQEGQSVKKGDILFILEAMKMENEIFAPCDGTVTSVSVSAGTSVTSGAPLCSIA